MTNYNRPNRGGAEPKRKRKPHKKKSSSRRRTMPEFGVTPAQRKMVTKTLDQCEYIAFDIETTGGNPEKNGITEICALKVRGDEVIDRFYTLVNPKISIPPIVRKMTGITNKMVKDAPTIDKVMPDFIKFVDEGVLVSHNTIGDMKFLRYYSKEVSGEPITNFFLCTHLLVEKLVKEAPNKSLSGLSEFFKIREDAEMHRADADARVTLELFRHLVKRLKAKKVNIVEDAIRFQGDYESGMRLGWAVEGLDFRSLPNDPGLIYLYGSNNRLKFLCSAVNIKRDIQKLTRYGQLPRPLLRIVLNSYRLDYKVCDSQLHARRTECQELLQRQLKYDPTSWHQRVVNGIHFYLDEGTVKAGIGGVKPGTLAAFGPVSDRKEAKQILSRLADACGCSEHSEFQISREYLPLVVAWFKGLLPNVEDDLRRQEQSLFGRISRVFTADRTPDLRKVCGKLSEIPVKSSWESLLDVNGIAFVGLRQQQTSQIFQVAHSQIVAQSRMNGHFQKLSSDQKLVEKKKKSLGKKLGRPRKKPLTKVEATQTNALLWWIYSNTTRTEGIFVRR